MEIKHLALGMVNAYLVKQQDNFFLIDTGTAMSRSKLIKALEKEGIKPNELSSLSLRTAILIIPATVHIFKRNSE